LFEVGAMLESAAVHPGRSARAHLLALAQANGIGRGRVEQVLGLVGLDAVASRRAGGYSLGMTQRLGVAAALLGDPGVLLLDERGRLLADTSVAEFVQSTSAGHVRVRTPAPELLTTLLRAHAATVEYADDGSLAVTGADEVTVGELAASQGIVLHELATRAPSLEEAFMTMTRDAVYYQPHPTAPAVQP
jgi:ABC-2 type transport system ATP-binding protein